MISPGERILVSIREPFHLDFSRNPIWNLNCPGMASLPPGLPITPDWSTLRDFLWHRADRFPAPYPSDILLGYLRQIGINFLIFERGEIMYYQDPNIYNNLRSYEIPYHRELMIVWHLVYKQLLELPNKCKILYDDGDFICARFEAAGWDSQPETPVFR